MSQGASRKLSEHYLQVLRPQVTHVADPNDLFGELTEATCQGESLGPHGPNEHRSHSVGRRGHRSDSPGPAIGRREQAKPRVLRRPAFHDFEHRPVPAPAGFNATFSIYPGQLPLQRIDQ
jgi:hypothetical protein